MSASNYADRIVRGIVRIVVTNHAGRQVDGAIASLDALDKIVDAVGDSIYVWMSPSFLLYDVFFTTRGPF
jgi:isopentenyl diphosphate isomerase/L-lactate dehydrogenase-like FMN-dependent dehydrogenase